MTPRRIAHAPTSPSLQMICMSDSRKCNAACSYCPSRGMAAKSRLSLPDLKGVVDFFVAYTNGVKQKPRGLSFVLNTLGEPSLGMDNVAGLADYVAYINDRGRCAVPVYFFMSSTNLLDLPDSMVSHVNQYGYVTASLHSRPAADYAERIRRLDGHVIVEGTDVIPKRPINLYARYREILGCFSLASMRPVREAPMTIEDSSLWVAQIAECARAFMSLADMELAGFLSRLSFTDSILHALRLLDTRARQHYRCLAGISSLQVTPEMEFFPCMFVQHDDLRMGDIERGLDLDWHRRFEERQRAGTRQECAACECVTVCGGPCLDWARKDPTGDGFFSPAECVYRRGLFQVAAELLAHIRARPPVTEALRGHFDLQKRDWGPKTKEAERCSRH